MFKKHGPTTIGDDLMHEASCSTLDPIDGNTLFPADFEHRGRQLLPTVLTSRPSSFFPCLLRQLRSIRRRDMDLGVSGEARAYKDKQATCSF